MTLDELMRLTKRTAAIAERLQRVARHSQADADGLVINAELAYLEHQVQELISIVQLRAIKTRVAELPDLAVKRPRRKQSTEIRHNVPVQQFDMQGLER